MMARRAATALNNPKTMIIFECSYVQAWKIGFGWRLTAKVKELVEDGRSDGV
jgi:hypothetical protein